MLSLALVGLLAPAASPTPNWTAQVDPLTVTLGFTHVQIERTFNKDWSLYVGPSLRLHDNPFSKGADKSNVRGYGLEAGLRRYFSGDAPNGSWVLVRGVAAYLTLDEGPTRSGAGGYISGLGGYTWIFDSGLVLAAGLGVNYFQYALSGDGITGFLPAAHTTFGYAF